MIGIVPPKRRYVSESRTMERKADYTLQIHDSQDSRFHKVEMLSCTTMAEDAKKRVVIRNYIVPLLSNRSPQSSGIVDKDGNVELTGHKQVSIRYDQTVEVKDKASGLLEEISVDGRRHGGSTPGQSGDTEYQPLTHAKDGMMKLLEYRHFVSFEDAGYFLDLVLIQI